MVIKVEDRRDALTGEPGAQIGGDGSASVVHVHAAEIRRPAGGDLEH